MSKVMLSDSTFTVCPEGEHFFKIAEAKHDEKFGLITITLKTPDGYTDTERYQLINSDGEINDGAVSAFSYLAKCAMNDMTLTEIDPVSLKNHYIKATVSHTEAESKKTPGKILKFASISNIEAATAEDWNAEVPQQAVVSKPTDTTATAKPKATAGFDLDALFGRK